MSAKITSAKSMTAEHFDVVVIGAGIHGAGIAQAAAAYGYRVLVLEKHKVAGGTSSRSSKLIHGGLRYLETGQFALVRECLRERDLLLKLAPDLVRLTPFYIPIYEYTSRSPWKVRAGLSLYALLGGVRANTRFKTVPRVRWDRLQGLTTDKLLDVYQYYDAQTDDTALTKSVLQSAMQLGAELRVPAEFHNAQIKDQCEIQYLYNGSEHACSATVLINAAGPWVNEVLKKISPAITPVAVDLVQGTHIVVQEKVGDGIYYLEAPQDRRAVFVIPWQNRIMIGTTETVFKGVPDNVKPLESEVTYLINTFSHYFPVYESQRLEIVEQFAGLRVLPKAGTVASKRSRDTIIYLNDNQSPKVASVYGGKLTAYRTTAEKVMHKLIPVLPRRKFLADTKSLSLQPAKF